MLNLNHNYGELNFAGRVFYALASRRLLREDDRFFFEGSRSWPGQMYLQERRALYETIVSSAPRQSLEIGTGTGGGSTFFIAEAYRKLGHGRLVTLEQDLRLHHLAVRRYQRQLSYLAPYVKFLQGGEPALFLPYIREAGGQVDCLFLDGSDDPDQTLQQYEALLPYMRTGSLLIAHDWNTVKMSLLRPTVERDGTWCLQLKLDQPESVGFVVFQRGDVGS